MTSQTQTEPTKAEIAKLKRRLFPKPPEPSAQVERLLDLLYRKMDGQWITQDAWAVAHRIAKIPQPLNGYVRVCTAWEPPTLHRIYRVLRIEHIDPEPDTFHVLVLRQFHEEELACDDYPRSECISAALHERFPGQWTHRAHSLREDDTLSPCYRLETRFHAKAAAAEPGTPFPYGTRRTRTRMIATRLAPEQEARLLNRAAYIVPADE